MFAKSRDQTFINYLLPESLAFTCARILFLIFQKIMAEFYSLFPYFLDPLDPYSPFKFLIFCYSSLFTSIGHKDYNNHSGAYAYKILQVLG